MVVPVSAVTLNNTLIVLDIFEFMRAFPCKR